MVKFTSALLLLPMLVNGGCPYKATLKDYQVSGQTLPKGLDADFVKSYGEALAKVDFNAVKSDIKAMLGLSQSFWLVKFAK